MLVQARKKPFTYYFLYPNYYSAVNRISNQRSWLECLSSSLANNKDLQAFSFHDGHCYQLRISGCVNIRSISSSLREARGVVQTCIRSDIVEAINELNRSSTLQGNLALGNGFISNHSSSNLVHIIPLELIRDQLLKFQVFAF